ncbi:hypothetical protein RSAG8_01010, partial [Rhizoctonia solani AG-8 WAC10335]
MSTVNITGNAAEGVKVNQADVVIHVWPRLLDCCSGDVPNTDLFPLMTPNKWGCPMIIRESHLLSTVFVTLVEIIEQSTTQYWSKKSGLRDGGQSIRT